MSDKEVVERKLRVLMVEDNQDRVDNCKVIARNCRCNIVWAKSAGMAIGMLRRDSGRVYDGIMIDHDLQDQKITSNDGNFNGKDVAMAVIRYVDKDVPIFVHSSNRR